MGLSSEESGAKKTWPNVKEPSKPPVTSPNPGKTGKNMDPVHGNK